MRFIRYFCIVVLFLTIERCQATLKSSVINNVKRSSVYIEHSMGSGSGFVYKKDNRTEFIVTNAHVVKGHENVGVYFGSGEKNQFKLNGKVVAIDDNYDLAIIKVTSTRHQLPSPLKISKDQLLNRNNEYYMAGFPFGKSIALGGKPPKLSITRATFQERINRDGQLYRLQFTGDANHGNSGGAVVDKSGALCGVVAAYLPERVKKTLAIPLTLLEKLSNGNIKELSIAQINNKTGTISLDVSLITNDAFSNIARIGILTGPGKQPVKYNKVKEIKPINNKCKYLKYVDGKYGGTFVSDFPPNKDTEYQVQFKIVYKNRKTIYTKPQRIFVTSCVPDKKLNLNTKKVDFPYFTKQSTVNGFKTYDLPLENRNLEFSNDNKFLFALDGSTLYKISRDNYRALNSLRINQSTDTLSRTANRLVIGLCNHGQERGINGILIISPDNIKQTRIFHIKKSLIVTSHRNDYIFAYDKNKNTITSIDAINNTNITQTLRDLKINDYLQRIVVSDGGNSLYCTSIGKTYCLKVINGKLLPASEVTDLFPEVVAARNFFESSVPEFDLSNPDKPGRNNRMFIYGQAKGLLSINYKKKIIAFRGGIYTFDGLMKNQFHTTSPIIQLSPDTNLLFLKDKLIDLRSPSIPSKLTFEETNTTLPTKSFTLNDFKTTIIELVKDGHLITNSITWTIDGNYIYAFKDHDIAFPKARDMIIKVSIQDSKEEGRFLLPDKYPSSVYIRQLLYWNNSIWADLPDASGVLEPLSSSANTSPINPIFQGNLYPAPFNDNLYINTYHAIYVFNPDKQIITRKITIRDLIRGGLNTQDKSIKTIGFSSSGRSIYIKNYRSIYRFELKNSDRQLIYKDTFKGIDIDNAFKPPNSQFICFRPDFMRGKSYPDQWHIFREDYGTAPLMTLKGNHIAIDSNRKIIYTLDMKFNLKVFDYRGKLLKEIKLKDQLANQIPNQLRHLHIRKFLFNSASNKLLIGADPFVFIITPPDDLKGTAATPSITEIKSRKKPDKHAGLIGKSLVKKTYTDLGAKIIELSLETYLKEYNLCWDPNYSHFYVIAKKGLILKVSCPEMKVVSYIDFETEVSSITSSKYGLLACLPKSNKLAIIDHETMKISSKIPTQGETQVLYNEDSTAFIRRDWNASKMTAIDLKSRKVLNIFDFRKIARAAGYYEPNGTSLVSYGNYFYLTFQNTLFKYKYAAGKLSLVKTFKAPPNVSLDKLCLSGRGKLIYALSPSLLHQTVFNNKTSVFTKNKKRAFLLDTETLTPIHLEHLIPKPSQIDDKLNISYDKDIMISSIKTGRPLRTFTKESAFWLWPVYGQKRLLLYGGHSNFKYIDWSQPQPLLSAQAQNTGIQLKTQKRRQRKSPISRKNNTQTQKQAKVTKIFIKYPEKHPRYMEKFFWDNEKKHFYVITKSGIIKRISYPDYIEKQEINLNSLVSKISMSKNGLVLFLKKQKRIVVLDMASLEIKKQISVPLINDIISDPNLDFIIVRQKNIFLKINLSTGKVMAYFNSEQQLSGYIVMQLSHDGKFLLVRSDSSLHKFIIDKDKIIYAETVKNPALKYAQKIIIGPKNKYFTLVPQFHEKLTGKMKFNNGIYIYRTSDLKTPYILFDINDPCRDFKFDFANRRIQAMGHKGTYIKKGRKIEFHKNPSVSGYNGVYKDNVIVYSSCSNLYVIEVSLKY